MMRVSFIGLALVTAMAACSSNRPPATADGALDADAPSDADLTSATCQQIRLCVAGGGGVDTCRARGTTQAQDLHMGLLSCLSSSCPGGLFECVCRETCQPDGYCLDQTDACLTASGLSVDSVCETFCG